MNLSISLPVDNEAELSEALTSHTSIRDVSFERCSHSSFAFWFFYRFRLTDEAFPNFYTRDWATTKLLYNTRTKKHSKKRQADEEEDEGASAEPEGETAEPVGSLAQKIHDGLDYDAAHKMVNEAFAKTDVTLERRSSKPKGKLIPET